LVVAISYPTNINPAPGTGPVPHCPASVNLSRSKDGHFIPLIPYEIRIDDRNDVFRGATNDDSGELDLDLVAETDLPPMSRD
jgi:hypothetical protein